MSRFVFFIIVITLVSSCKQDKKKAEAEDRLNHFPDLPKYQCFLPDKNNKVLMVGNPVLNPKIWELYKQTVSGRKQTETIPVTNVVVEQPEETGAFHKTIRVHRNVENRDHLS